MKKNLTLLVVFFSIMIIQAQVGINTDAPKATLDISGKKDAAGVLLATDITGFQAPRLTRAELTAKGNDLYGSDQKGALVYVTDISSGTAAAQRVNVTSTGYYYFDGLLWQKLNGSGNSDVTANNGLTKSADNIKLGGTLLENTSIATAGFNTTFTGTGKVGIGVSPPVEKLDVDGNIRFRQVPTSAALAATDEVMVIASDGTGKKVKLEALQPPGKFTLFQTYDDVATTNVDRTVNGTWANEQAINNVNLGLSIPVVIPAKTIAKVIVNYSTPIGANADSECLKDRLNYYGIRFLKGGVEQPMGSRKYSFPNSSGGVQMSTVSGVFIEEVTNNTASAMTVTYALNGYLEFAQSTIPSPCGVRFNMWAASGTNYNWGRGAMTIQLFTKPL